MKGVLLLYPFSQYGLLRHSEDKTEHKSLGWRTGFWEGCQCAVCWYGLLRVLGGGAEDVEGRAPAGTSEWLSSAKVPSLWS